ncbi:F0F1 ATP synthase subunit A [Aquamicrobium segne]|uniref:ATP synthase subunit a n=1 Tax=Aquamicrobium segne TaxID=469547 RepID=A0ABW0GUW2_9HYPH
MAAADKVDPIHQFHINQIVPIEIGGYDLSFTNSSLFMVLTIVTASAFLLLSTSGRHLVPSRWQSVGELVYEFIRSMLKDTTGEAGMRYFPFVFSLFMFILFANMLGLFPYFFTVTSHIIVTFSLAMLVISVVVICGIKRNGLGFFKIFVPSGIPAILVPLVAAIEVVSFLSRPVSLSVRLFASILAGHITLKVFAGFIVSMGALGTFGIAGSILPIIMTVAITGLEVLVAGLQAYVFAILTCMYLNDTLGAEH